MRLTSIKIDEPAPANQTRAMASEAQFLSIRKDVAKKSGSDFRLDLHKRKKELIAAMCREGPDENAYALNEELRTRIETVIAFEHMWLGSCDNFDAGLEKGRDGRFHVRLDMAASYDWTKGQLWILLRPGESAAGI